MKIEPCVRITKNRLVLLDDYFPAPEGESFYSEAQMRQLGEACAVAAWSAGMSLHKGQPNARDIGSKCASEIRELTKEMLP